MKKTGFAALAVSLVLLFAVAAAVYGRLSGRYAPPPVPVPPAVKNTEAPPGAAASRRGTQAPDTTGLPAQTSGTSAAGNGSADNGSARNGRSGNGSSRNGGPEQKHSAGFPGA